MSDFRGFSNNEYRIDHTCFGERRQRPIARILKRFVEDESCWNVRLLVAGKL